MVGNGSVSSWKGISQQRIVVIRITCNLQYLVQADLERNL